MKNVLASLMVATALLGCSESNSGAKYLGRWEEVVQHVVIVNVRPNDSAFLVDITGTKNPFTTQTETKTYPGTLKDGFLLVVRGDGFGDDPSFAVDGSTGHLLGMGREFVKGN